MFGLDAVFHHASTLLHLPLRVLHGVNAAPVDRVFRHLQRRGQHVDPVVDRQVAPRIVRVDLALGDDFLGVAAGAFEPSDEALAFVGAIAVGEDVRLDARLAAVGQRPGRCGLAAQ